MGWAVVPSHFFSQKNTIMAIINSVAIGKAVNSIGDITYQTIKGRTIARQKPTNVYNPKTINQARCRTKFAYIVRFWKEKGSFFKPYYTRLVGYGSPYNTCISLNNKAEEQVVQVVLGKLQMQTGYYMSYGIYPLNSIYVSYIVADNSFIVESDDLINNLRLGDEFIFYYRKRFSQDDFVAIKYVDQAMINLVRKKEWMDVDLPPDHTLVNVIYYSPRTNRSNVVRMHMQYKLRT